MKKLKIGGPRQLAPDRISHRDVPARRGPVLALGAPSLGGNTLGSSRKEALRVAPRDVPECVGGDGARRTPKVTKRSRVGSIDVASTRAP